MFLKGAKNNEMVFMFLLLFYVGSISNNICLFNWNKKLNEEEKKYR